MYKLNFSLLSLLLSSLRIPSQGPDGHHDSYEWSRESPTSLKDACNMKPGSIFVLKGYNGNDEPSVDYGPLCRGKLDDDLKCDWLTLEIVDCKRVALVFVDTTSQKTWGDSNEARRFGARAHNVFSRIATPFVRPFGSVRFDSIVWGPSGFLEPARALFDRIGQQAPILQSVIVDVNDFGLVDTENLPFIYFVDFTRILHSDGNTVATAIQNWNSIALTEKYSGWYMTFKREAGAENDITKLMNTHASVLTAGAHFLGRHYRDTDLTASLLMRDDSVRTVLEYTRQSVPN